ncbi:MAG: aminotransferase, partial [Anaerolineae bacterium]|nr:aminotransferase [Anaerolineae bacterium]
DFYFGNCHKWLCAPKGAAFLFARPERQHLLDPLVIGWGWGAERSFSFGSDYLDSLQYLGTDDLSSYFSVPAAIAFQEKHDWTAVRQACHTLLREAVADINQVTGLPSPYPDDSFYQQMAVIPLPPQPDLPAFKSRLYDEFRIEVPGIQWQGSQFIRISIQGYNGREDVEALISALQELLKL